MIAFEEAYSIALNRAGISGPEKVDFRESIGRILAEDIVSDIDMPPFDKSAMDGFACRREDLGMALEVLETIPAGTPPTLEVTSGYCSRIMTGAMLPHGADTVIKIEDTIENADATISFTAEKTKSNIAIKAEDVSVGQTVLKAGIQITSRHIPTLAAVGADQVSVYKRPRVGVISTGTELVEPWQKPGPGQIRNSNGYQLIAQVGTCGGIASYHGIVDDTEEITVNTIKEAIEANDVVLLTGGVSMGDFDLVPEMLEKAGLNILFRQIAIQPGKPTLFAEGNGKYCFALPGNPVSSFVLFEMLVKPFLWKMQSREHIPVSCRIAMGISYTRKKSGRMSVLPVRISEGKAFPVDYHGSAHIHALTEANGLVIIPKDKIELTEGEIVDARPV